MTVAAINGYLNFVILTITSHITFVAKYIFIRNLQNTQKNIPKLS